MTLPYHGKLLRNKKKQTIGKDLTVKPETTELLKGSIGSYLLEIGLTNI